MDLIFRRSTDKCLIQYFAFCLQILVLIGLTAAPGCAGEGTVKREHYVFNQRQQRSAVVDTKPNPQPIDPAAVPLLSLAEFPVLEEADRKPAEKEKTIEPVTRKLPIWGEQARQRGFELPLPFGMGANYVYMDQGIKISNLKVGIGDPVIEISGLDFSDARAHDSSVTVRLDMWLLPFVNLYGLFGTIDGEAKLDLDISRVTGSLPSLGLPPIFEPNKTIDLNISYNGFTYGGGVTLAGGYKSFFASLDTNYTYSNVDIVDGNIKTLTISPRLGLLVEPPGIMGSFGFWIGAMYMNYKQTITDDIRLNEIDPRLPPVGIDFKMDVQNDQPWNFLFGGQWEISKRLQITAEGGVGDRQQVITGISYRF